MMNLSKYLSLIIYLLVIFTSKTFSSESVNEIIIKGNQRISSDTIKLFSEVKINQEIDENNFNEILKNLYETNYFKDIKITLKNGLLTIVVEENPIIGNINIEGVKAKKIEN